MEKIVLFYKFVPVVDPETTMYWQRALCEKLELKGRVIISPQGINATLGGELQNLKYYTRDMRAHSIFAGTKFEWSDGSAADFPKLSVKVKDEIVAFEAADELEVDKNGVVGGGKHLSPDALHRLVAEHGDDVVFYDGRNMFEAEIGHFKNAVIPKVEHTRDFKRDLDDGEITKYKDRPIVTYCTGGIRCEVLSAMMKSRGFKDVYQLDGGIVKYGERFGSEGLFDGKLFVFDDRMKVAFSEDADDIASCYSCGAKTSRQVNSTGSRRKLFVCCENCPVPPD